MAPIITVANIPSDVAALVDPNTLQTMVDGANARALRVAPCLSEPTTEQLAEAKLILLGAVTRWSQAGSGAVVQHTASVYSETIDTRNRTGYNFWPSEINQLGDLCGGASRSVFSVDTVPTIEAAGYPSGWL